MIIGTLFGTRDAPLRSSAAKAMRDGRAFDDRRIDTLAALQQALLAEAPAAPRLPRERDDARIFAFFEAYFSNFIEGTEFTVDEAAEIVFDGVIPAERPADAHDVLGTFRAVSDGLWRLPTDVPGFVDLLRRRHAMVMEARPTRRLALQVAGEPRRRDGFVAPDLVDGRSSAVRLPPGPGRSRSARCS